MARPWGFWTEHKLDILSAYLHQFTTASKSVGTTVYLDLFAGQLENVARRTGAPLDGSPVRALSTEPPLTTVVLFEMPARAAALRAALTERFPGRDLRVYPGDCNSTIDQALHDLDAVRWAPTFAFLDQEGAEVQWATLERLAAHKQRSRFKVELWMLLAHSQLPRALGIAHTTDEKFAERVTAMLGTDAWRAAYEARRSGAIDGEQFRDELTNWMRWRLERDLGYRHTHAFELRNEQGGPVYSMVFATDHAAGNNIMSHLYARAAERHPQMREEALALRRAQQEEQGGRQMGLFQPMVRQSSIPAEDLYRPARPSVPFGLDDREA